MCSIFGWMDEHYLFPQLNLGILWWNHFLRLVGALSSQSSLFWDKNVECLYNKGIARTIQGDKIQVIVKHILAIQAKCSVPNDEVPSEPSREINQLPIAREFIDVFSEELPRFLSTKEVNYKIYLVPRETIIYKAHDWLGTNELSELKMQLQELLEKGFIQSSGSPWGAPMLFVKRKVCKKEGWHIWHVYWWHNIE